MPSDQEYLQSAGIQDAGEAAAPQTEAPQTETPPTPQEMFELAGNKYPINTEFQFVHGGKQLKVPYNSLVNTYRQAAHMQDRWNDFKKVQAEQAEKLKSYDRLKGFYDKYGALQEWSEKNPDQWNALYELWQNKDRHLLNHQIGAQQQPQQPGGPNLDPLVNEITNLKSQLSKYDQMLQKMEDSEKEAAEAKNLEFVKNEVQSFAKEFPEIEMTELDPDGVPLWSKIVNWGEANGFQEFTPAAYMYLKQRIAETYQARARSEAMKSVKTDHQAGIVKRSAMPLNGQGQRMQPKNMSYAELADLAKSGQFAAGA